jgi:hypothetical protein
MPVAAEKALLSPEFVDTGGEPAGVEVVPPR